MTGGGVRVAAGTYWRLLCLTYFRRRSVPAFQRRGLVFCTLFFLLYPVVEAFHALFCLLDCVFFRGFRRLEIKQPVFLIGNPAQRNHAPAPAARPG